MNALFGLAILLGAAPSPTPVAGETCLEMRGGIYEISADGVAGEPADAPRRPYVVLSSEGPSVWVNAGGIALPMTFVCVPEELSLTVAGRTTVARRKDARFELNEKPLVRYVPKPENSTRCQALAGTRWRIVEPVGAGKDKIPAARERFGRNAFQSDIEPPATEHPGLAFSADGTTVEHFDGRIRRESIPYTCDAAGVRFTSGNRMELLTWSADGMSWFDRSLVAP